MAAVYVNHWNNAVSGSDISVTVSGVTAGNVLLAFLGKDDDVATSNTVGGMTLQVGFESNNAIYTEVWKKDATGSESTITFASDSEVYCLTVVEVAGGDYANIANSTPATNGAAATITTNSITPGADDAFLGVIFTVDRARALDAIDSNLTELYSVSYPSVDNSGGISHKVGYEEQGTATARTYTQTWTTSDQCSAVTVVVPSSGPPNDPCLADDLSSNTQVSTPALAGEHTLLADDLSTATTLSTPVLAGEHTLLADDLTSATTLSTPTAAETSILLADDLESATSVSTPSVGQDHQILADDLESATTVSTPAVAQGHILLADDLASATSLSTPAVGQDHQILADDLASATTLSTPALGVITNALADDLASATSLSTPAVAQGHILLADDLASATSLSTPTATTDTADDLLADDLQSLTQLSTPAVTQVHTLLADNLESATTLSTPSASENVEKLRPDADTSIGSWTTHLNGTSNLYQMIDEVTPDDADYVRSEPAPILSAAKFKLSNPLDTIEDTASVLVKYRYGKNATDSNRLELRVNLIQGASTIIASWSHGDVSSVVTLASKPLTLLQKQAITDYDDLFIEFVAETYSDTVRFTNTDFAEFNNSDSVEFG